MTSQVSTAPPQSGTRYSYFVVILLMLTITISYIDRMALAVLAPLIKADVHISDAQLGLLTGFAFSVFYAISGLPLARWADRGVRRDIIALAITFWSIMTALTGAVQNFWHLFITRMGVGAGEAGTSPAATSMLCDYIPLERRTLAFAVYNFGCYLGIALSMVLAGWLGLLLGWRWTFVALGAVGLVMAVVIKFTLREPLRGRFDKTAPSPVLPFPAVLKALFGCRTYRVLLMAFITIWFFQYGLNQWWPSFYNRVHGLPLSTIGTYLGIAVGVGSAVGSIAGGVFADRMVRRSVRLPLILGGVTLILAMPCAVASLFVSSATVSFVLVFVACVLWTVSNGPIIVSISGVVDPSMRGISSALTLFCASLVGYGMGPFFVGLISDALLPSYGVESLRYALLLPCCVVPLAALTVFSAAKSVTQDLKVAVNVPDGAAG